MNEIDYFCEFKLVHKPSMYPAIFIGYEDDNITPYLGYQLIGP